ncbi:DUF2800 domain-containing protein [Rhizobium wenxiniae]|uniref:DUF2800 domain-containing protein n=1 Tax=Rhizobium wenxiniae TaxID=1737357 RepID=UPI003C2087BA
MVCTASVPLIDHLLAAGELAEDELDDRDLSELVDEADFSAYDGETLDLVRDASQFSAEGTVMHEVRELCLTLGFDPHDFVGKTMTADGYSFVIDDDMADRLVAGIDWIRQFTANPMVEKRIDLSTWLPGQFGTTDCSFLFKDVLGGSDYKNGVGEPVEAKGNRQQRLYLLGSWEAFGRPDVKRILINIDQPRAGGMKHDEITLDELLEFGEEVKRVYQRIATGKVQFVPTVKGCRWCPVRKTSRGCAARNAWFLQMLGPAVADVSLEPSFVDPDQMPRAQRFYVVRHAKAIAAWLRDLAEQSLAAAVNGDPDPGSKAIEGSDGNRFFKDPHEAELLLVTAMGHAAYKPRQTVGFTEIDRKLKPGKKKKGNPEIWAELEKLVDRPAGSPKLVPEDHPKPALVPYEDQFDDL